MIQILRLESHVMNAAQRGAVNGSLHQSKINNAKNCSRPRKRVNSITKKGCFNFGIPNLKQPG